MGLAAHQEEIIAQLYREMYRKLVAMQKMHSMTVWPKKQFRIRSELHARNTTNS